MIGRWVGIAGIVVLLAACGGGTGVAPTATRPPAAAPKPAVTATAPAAAPTPAVTRIAPAGGPTGTPGAGGDPMTNPAVQAAVADLARRRGIDAARVRIGSVEAVDWPDAGLGCPEPGRVYVQVITPGWRTTLEVDG